MIHLKYIIEFRVTVSMSLCKNNYVYEGQKHKWIVCEPFTKRKRVIKSYGIVFCEWVCLYINSSNN